LLHTAPMCFPIVPKKHILTFRRPRGIFFASQDSYLFSFGTCQTALRGRLERDEFSWSLVCVFFVIIVIIIIVLNALIMAFHGFLKNHKRLVKF
jgi:hypothetical protein